MIKASELRIGNWVYNEYTRKPQQTYPMMIAQIASIEKEGKEVNMSGVPLSEEWLLKFGFDRPYVPPVYEKVNKDLSDKIRIHKVADDVYKLGHYEGLGGIIRYVHQLQNLYFALIGEELSVALEKA